MDTKTCPRCVQTLPRASFKRHASLAQTRAWLQRNDVKKRLWYEGKVCNSCAKPKPPSKMQPEQLRKRLVSEGDKPKFLVDSIVAQREAAGRKRQSEAGVKAIAKRYAPFWHPVMEQVTKLHLRAYMRTRYAAMRRDDAVYAAWAEILLKLTHARAQLRSMKKLGKKPPKDWLALARLDGCQTVMVQGLQ